MNCQDIYYKYKHHSRFTGSHYIDSEGYQIPTSTIICANCMFGVNSNLCILYKELGQNHQAISQCYDRVRQTHYCTYFLIKHFSGNNNENILVRKQVMAIAQSYNYPKTYS